MTARTWQETQEHIGMPAAINMEQSIILAQLEILRRLKNVGAERDRAIRRFIAIAEGRGGNNDE